MHFKLLLLGDSGVGKTSLLQRFMGGRFTAKYHSSVGVELGMHYIEVAGEVVQLLIWDASGEKRFRPLLPTYYREVHGILLVYDATNPSSFKSLPSWLDEIETFGKQDVSIVLVGNKCEDLESRKISQLEGVTFADGKGLAFCEASARSGVNVDQIFATLSLKIHEIYKAQCPDTYTVHLKPGPVQVLQDTGSIRLAGSAGPKNTNKGGCCW
ncbi:GL14977 [Drosophila persimilis]|uniref:GL14977 n=1 Tax=Drosophila persimilis TaxID=7234 RepID=B4H0D8_DROPE|nr:ras-related protein Rab-1A [Drosophila persimilis]EDW29733.1 GL14977 [Drosophila persimilis]